MTKKLKKKKKGTNTLLLPLSNMLKKNVLMVAHWYSHDIYIWNGIKSTEKKSKQVETQENGLIKRIFLTDENPVKKRIDKSHLVASLLNVLVLNVSEGKIIKVPYFTY